MDWDFQEDGRVLLFSHIVFCKITLTPLLPVELENYNLGRKGQNVQLCLSEIIIKLNLLFMTCLLLMLINHQYLWGNEQGAQLI